MSNRSDSNASDEVQKWGTFGVGVLGGVTGGVMTIWEKFYDYWKTIPEYAGIVADRDTERAAVRAERLPYGEASKKYKSIEKDYLGKFSARLKEVDGIVSADNPMNIARGTFQRFERLGHFDKGRVLFNAGLSGVVTIGAVWALSNHTRLSEKLDEAEQSNGRSAA